MARHFTQLVFIVCCLATLSAALRDVIQEMREYAKETEAYLDDKFIGGDFAENVWLDSSLSPAAEFPKGADHQCIDTRGLANDFARKIVEGAEAPGANDLEIPLEDTDNKKRRSFDWKAMVKRKFRVWDETTGNSIPVNCVNRTHPLTSQWSRKADRKYRLLCITFTYVKKHDKAILANQIWGRRCTRHIIVTNKDGGISSKIENGKENVVVLTPKGGEGYNNMWQKTRATLLFLKSQREASVNGESVDSSAGKEVIMDSYDYFFFGGDDVFLIPENLHKMVNEAPLQGLHTRGVPLHFGYRQITAYDQPFISGAGYVMNAITIKMVAYLGLSDHKNCAPELNAAAEDVYLAQCLNNALGIVSRDTRDAFGEDRFHVLNGPMLMWEARDIAFSWWWRDYRDRQVPRGLNMMSRDTVLVHYMQSQPEIEEMAQLVYGVVESRKEAD